MFKQGCQFLFAKRNDEPFEVRWVQWRVVWILGFLGYFRCSDAYILNLGDVEVVENGVRINLKRSKNDQQGEGETVFIGDSEHPWYSPRTAVEEWRKAVTAKPGNTPETPWMRKVKSIKNIWYVDEQRLPMDTYTVIVRLMIEQIAPQEDSKNYSAHSLRRGGASFAFKMGIPETRIQLQGRWKSDAYRRYIHVHEEELLELTKALGL